MKPVAVALKAHQGWVNAVAVLTDSEPPAPVHVQRVDLAEGLGREAIEPYHVAGGWLGLERVPRPDDPAAVVRRGRRKQTIAACERLHELRSALAHHGLEWRRAVVLTSRGRLGDDLEHILASHASIHIAEGEAVRDATRTALRMLRISTVDQDEKSVLFAGAKVLACGDCDRLMKERRPPGARSWRKEERVIALAAWLHRR